MAEPSDVPPEVRRFSTAALATARSALGSALVRAPWSNPTTPMSTVSGWASMKASAACWAAASRVGATSVARHAVGDVHGQDHRAGAPSDRQRGDRPGHRRPRAPRPRPGRTTARAGDGVRRPERLRPPAERRIAGGSAGRHRRLSPAARTRPTTSSSGCDRLMRVSAGSARGSPAASRPGRCRSRRGAAAPRPGACRTAGPASRWSTSSANRARNHGSAESTSSCSPVSASSTTITPTSGSVSSAASTTRTATTSLRCASRSSGRCHSPVPMKSEITTTSERRASDATVSQHRGQVGGGRRPGSTGRSSSRPIRSAWWRPVPGRTRRAAPESYRTAPTRLPLRPSSLARTRASSVSTSCFPRPGPPTRIEAERSSTSQAVSSRSSLNSRTCGSSSRAVTFQSMCRASSPSTYGRSPAKSRPLPRRGRAVAALQPSVQPAHHPPLQPVQQAIGR